MAMILTRDSMKDWGLHKRGSVDVLVYSMGSIDEAHGPALQRDNDDVVAKRTAVLAAETLGAQYKGHLPFGSDRVGEMARDWCPAWIPPEEAVKGIIEYVKRDIGSWPNEVSHVAIISGHGGNNFLGDEQEVLSEGIVVPTLYVHPFVDCKTTHPELGEIEVEHANHGEHSVAEYMGVLFREGLEEINEQAGKDPEEALRKWPVLSGLGGYFLYGGPKYEALRNPDWGMADHAKRFLRERKIIADYRVGKALFEQNLSNAIEKIRDFTGKG